MGCPRGQPAHAHDLGGSRMRRFGATIWIGVVLFAGGLPGAAGAEGDGPSPRPPPVVQVTIAQMQLVMSDIDLFGRSPMPVPRPADVPDTHSPHAPLRSLRPRLRDTWARPSLRWDDHPQGPRWTAAAMSALRGPGARLLDMVPRDIQHWCPGYSNASRGQRAAFWAGLVSALAWEESTHSATAVGGGGQWFGLVQIAPGTARWRNCAVGTGQALLDGPANLRCGIRIMAITVPRDGVVAEGMRGVAADWGPFHSTRKREEMRNWVRQQDYCQVGTRPEMRPDGLATGPDGPAAAPGPLRPVPRPVMRVGTDLVAAN